MIREPHSPFLYCFDFDGTLVDIKNDHQTDPDFFQWLEKVENSQQNWVINTGRDLPYLLEGLDHAKFPIKPSFVICRERDLYELNEKGEYEPHHKWNRQCEQHINLTLKEARPLIQRFRKFLDKHTDAEWLEFPGDPAGVRSSSVEEMDEIVRWVDQQMHLIPALGYQRNSIWMRFGDHRYQKGSTTQHLAKLLGLSRQDVFVAGDGDNDLTMLHQKIAAFIVAPSNANYQVQQAVKKQLGYLASKPAIKGVIEGIEYFQKQSVESFKPIA